MEPDSEIIGPYGEKTQRDWEMSLVVRTIQDLPYEDPNRERMTRIWHECSFSGALREGFPPGTERLKESWLGLLRECRRTLQ